MKFMKKKALVVYFFWSCLSALIVGGQERSGRTQTTESPETLIRRALELRKHDHSEQALATLEKAISETPDSLRAHAEYVRTSTYDLERFDWVRAAYESQIIREPNNPIYPLALAIGQDLTPLNGKRPWFEKVIAIAPDSSAAHLARSFLIYEKEPAAALSELSKFIEADGSIMQAYVQSILLEEKRLGDIDGAIDTAQKWAARDDIAVSDFRGSGLFELWRLRLAKAPESESARTALDDELRRLAASSHDLDTLYWIRTGYSTLLKDPDQAKSIEERIRRLDPSWYPERGFEFYAATSDESGISRQLIAVNRQVSILFGMDQVDDSLEPAQQMTELEKLLTLQPSTGMKMLIYRRLFRLAEQAREVALQVRYGEKYRRALFRLDANDADPTLAAKISLALSDQGINLPAALKYAHRADELTAQFHPARRPQNTDEEWFKHGKSDKQQQDAYRFQRSLALEAVGWVLCKTNHCVEGEEKLRQAIALNRSERGLYHLGSVLEMMGRNSEAEKVKVEAHNEWIESIRRQFIKGEAAKDFQLDSIDGRKIRLSDLKGKVVLLNFWATWCAPCIKEMPLLVRTYERYKDNGFEVLAVSVDDKTERYKVPVFAREHKLTFPVLFDDGAQSLYKVSSFPTTFFIDRQGNVRLRQALFRDERSLEAIIGELVKRD